MAKFSDKWVQEKDPVGNITKEYFVDSEEITEGDKKIKIPYRSFNWRLGFPASFMRWFRLHLGKKYRVIGKNVKGHEIYGYAQDPVRHHLFSLIVQYANLLLAYNFFSYYFGANISFLAVAFFITHPISTQCVAWISGIGYLLSLFFALLNFNLLLLTHNYYITIPATVALTFLSANFLLPGCFNFILLASLGWGWEAGAAGLVSFVILFTWGREVVRFRVKAFKEQQMEATTKVTWRRGILLFKTVWYYLKLLVFPKRLGLFHKWGYHFEEPLQRIDRMFWLGILTVAVFALASFKGPFLILFASLWIGAYLFIFLNLITAQQFVVDRYVFMSSLGFCLLLAYLLEPYPILSAFLIGIYVMRIWVHLPTYKDDEHYYSSNYFNFPDSEVALGNLGVVVMGKGRAGTAIDLWNKSVSIYPWYDVAHYNLYSIFRSNGVLPLAKDYLQKCLDAKIVHFPEQWNKEMEHLNRDIAIQNKMNEFNQAMNNAINQNKLEDITKIKEELASFHKFLAEQQAQAQAAQKK